jgi:hypothetical protein
VHESSEPSWEPEPEPESDSVTENVSRRRSSSRHRRTRQTPDRVSRHRLRLVYFTLASMWGFVAGTVAILGGLSFGDDRVSLDTPLSVLMLVAAVLAVVGGAIVASAYRDASHRRR